MLVSDIMTLSIINNVRWIYILVQHDITKAVFWIVSNAAYLYVQTLQVRYTADIDVSYMSQAQCSVCKLLITIKVN